MVGSFKSTAGKTTCKRAFARFSWLSRASMYWGVAFRRRFDGWSYVLGGELIHHAVSHKQGRLPFCATG
jgi:hypothetical protein